MMSTKLFLAFAGLLPLVSSHPTSPSNSLDARTPYQECQPYTYWYVCANGYRGCFAQDPCSLPPIPTMADPAPPAATLTSPTTPVQTGEVFLPTTYNILPRIPFHSTDRVPHLDLEPAIRNNVAVFSGIPAGAKNCQLNWRVDLDTFPRGFGFGCSGDCLVSVRELSGLPTGVKINPETISAFVTESFDNGSIEFTGINRETKKSGVVEGTGPAVQCKETIVVELAIGINGGARNSRLFVEYTTFERSNYGMYIKWEM